MNLSKYSQILLVKNVRSWCFFDFGLSSYPTLILTFFYGAYYANNIAKNVIVGTTLWGYTISLASLISFFLFTFVLIYMRNYYRVIGSKLFFLFLILIMVSTACLAFFNRGINQYYPLIFILISFISFEVLNLFYNISLRKICKSNQEGFLSNIGWAFGYLGGLLSLMIAILFLSFTEKSNFKILGFVGYDLIGPFVAIWVCVFCVSHFRNFRLEFFPIPSFVSLYDSLCQKKIRYFLVSYFFFNNGIVCIFAFASMFASFLYNFSEAEILFLGIFINLTGIFGCILFAIFENRIGTEKCILLSITGLFLLTIILLSVTHKHIFWITALSIGFFIGPIQACSRSLLARKLPLSNQIGAFSLFSMFGNICAILGPFLVGYMVNLFDSKK